MDPHPVLFHIFIIFTGAAALATVALFARQAMLLAYILLGVLLGPSVLGLVSDPLLVKNMAEIGIMFLLFLLGLNLYPPKLLHMFRKATAVTIISSLVFALLGAGIGAVAGFNWQENVVIGAALMFSSTILGLKLLPTTVLHHQRAGEVMISVLLLQDLLAILVLLLLKGISKEGAALEGIGWLMLALPTLLGFAFGFERYVLIKLIRRFDKIHEYIFLVAIGWCLGIAELSALLGLSQEIGAFIAGVALATSPIAVFIAESLKPLRDFFLVMFFSSLGAGLDLGQLPQVLAPATLLAALILLVKPAVFKALLVKVEETARLSWEIGFRLGQASEFSLLVAVLAQDAGVIGERASYLIQLATVLTFIASSYLIIMRYPTPIAISDRLRRD
jgi:Kef-type K+ transport system membrane component KefB